MKGPRDTAYMGTLTPHGWLYGPEGAAARRQALRRIGRDADRKDYLYMRHATWHDAVSIHRSNRP